MHWMQVEPVTLSLARPLPVTRTCSAVVHMLQTQLILQHSMSQRNGNTISLYQCTRLGAQWEVT